MTDKSPIQTGSTPALHRKYGDTGGRGMDAEELDMAEAENRRRVVENVINTRRSKL